MPAAAHRDEQSLNELYSFGNGRRAYGAKAVNFGFFWVILGLRNDLTTVVGIVRLFGSVPLEKSPNLEY